MYYVYILQSEFDGTFYTGMTFNVESRLLEHNRGVTKTTKTKKPWRLVYTEEHMTREAARARELFWKSGQGREQRIKLPNIGSL